MTTQNNRQHISKRRRKAILKRRILIACMLSIFLILIFMILGISKLIRGHRSEKELQEIEQEISEHTPELEFESHAESKEATIAIAGDLCFHEDGYVLDYYDTVNDLKACISSNVLQLMQDADIFYLNHEYCIGTSGTPTTQKTYRFRANPERMELLKEMGTDLVSLANNHVFDYGEEALLETCDLLENANISYVGGGRNFEEAIRPVYLDVNGLRIGFVAASNAEVHRYTPQATETSPGILLAYDMTTYLNVVKEAAEQCDYLIAYMHWGTEDSNYLNEQQQSEGRQLLEAGADIVVGGHPHVLQGMEYVDGKPIIYSLGDFWFNKETKYTGLLQLKLDENGLKEMSFVPCLQTEYRVEHLDEPLEQEELYTFLEELSVNVEIDSNGILTEKND